MATPRSSRSKNFALKAFLSHRFKSPAVNRYFFDLADEVEEVQFEVDEGLDSTNVTRLERAVREADAFMGLYPYDGDESPTADELRKASRYFRLELDLAIRARKPALVFYDERFSQVLRFPASVRSQSFDLREIAGRGGSPQEERYQRAIERFCEEVRARMGAQAKRPLGMKREDVGLLVPTGKAADGGYSAKQIEAIHEVAAARGISRLEPVGWPLVLEPDTFSLLDRFDWIIADVSPRVMGTGIVGYLHGQAIPTLRLAKGLRSSDLRQHACYDTLFGGVEVGYRKDIVAWRRTQDLRAGLDNRLATLLAAARRISAATDARDYFESAALRNEMIFLSYSGKDADLGAEFGAALRKRFQRVFNYRDGESITPGEPWLPEIFDSLAKSALGVPLVSKDYLASGNCAHEAEEMIARQDNKEMRVIPVKLDKRKIEPPTWMRNRQYLQLYAYDGDVEKTVEKLVEFYDRRAKPKSS